MSQGDIPGSFLLELNRATGRLLNRKDLQKRILKGVKNEEY